MSNIEENQKQENFLFEDIISNYNVQRVEELLIDSDDNATGDRNTTCIEHERKLNRKTSCLFHNMHTNINKNTVQMRELKLIPTEIFWIRLAILIPLLPILSIVVYPYYNHIHQFQISWAAGLLVFKSGIRWNSAIIQQDFHHKDRYRSAGWSWYQSWETLFSTLIPSLVAAFALQLSFPSNYIVLAFAFLKSLVDEFSTNYVPNGYIELEITSCLITLMFLFCIFCVNVITYL